MLIIIQMRRIWFLMLILIFALSGCVGTDPEQATEVVNATPTPVQTTAKPFPVLEPRMVYVTIKGTMFNPSELNITNGTSVKWIIMDSGPYVVNVSGTKSPPLHKKDSWSFAFNKTGIYEYGCDLHPFMPHGRITVI